MTRTTFLLLFALVGRAFELQPAVFSPISIGIGTGEYFEELYSERPAHDAPFMFYSGERIRFKVQFVNGGRSAQTIQIPAGGIDRMFSVVFTREGVAVPVALRFQPTIEFEDGEKNGTVKATQTVQLAPGARLTVYGGIDSAPQEFGIYSIDVESELTDGAGRIVAPQSTRLPFEVRIPTASDKAEVARREGLQALNDGRLEQAEAAAGRLLAGNKNSSAAWTLRAQIAESRGRKADAIGMYRRALGIPRLALIGNCRRRQGRSRMRITSTGSGR